MTAMLYSIDKLKIYAGQKIALVELNHITTKENE